MDRIKSLNQQNSEPTIVETTTTTREKIIEELNQQYAQALQAKKTGHHEIAITKFQHLLDHDEIKTATIKSKGYEQLSLKYCCNKNLAELYVVIGSHQYAIEFFLKTRDLDDTDVFFMNKFGHVALQQQQYDLANAIFQRCLKLNSNHLPSFDGILRLLCYQEDYFEAYGWAIYCHQKFPKYQQAIDVLFDVYDLLKDSPLLQSAFNLKINIRINERSTKPSIFPVATINSNIPMDRVEAQQNFTKFKITTASFLSFGRLIRSIYSESVEITTYLTTEISLNDICNDINSCNWEYSPSDVNILKPIVSLQSFCETHACSSPTTIAQIFREIVPQYFSVDSMNDEVILAPSMVRTIIQPNYYEKIIQTSADNQHFHSCSIAQFQQFIDQLKVKPFHMLSITFEWLKWISMGAHHQLPIELQSLFLEIYDYHINHIDWTTWDGLLPSQALDLFQMSLLYIELKIAANVRDCVDTIPRLFDGQMLQHFYHVSLMKHMILLNCPVLLEARFNIIHFQLAIEQQNFELAMNLLDRCQENFVNVSNNIEIIHLPNQWYCPFIDSWIITNEKHLVHCLQQQQFVEQSILNGQFNDIQCILLNYQQRQYESQQLPAFYQLEILLEGFWHANCLKECLLWCEKGLNDSVKTWMKMKEKPQNNCEQFARQTNFLTVYLQHLLHDDRFDILTAIDTLNARKERLIRSMAHLLEIQYDSSFAEHKITLYNAGDYIRALDAILNSDTHRAESQSASLNIIVNVAEWIMLNNIPMADDGKFLQYVWKTLSENDYDAATSKFNRIHIIRLLSHSMFAYPRDIDEHKNICTCKRIPIDWNSAAILYKFIDSISNGMPDLEFKRLLNDLLDSIPDDVHMVLFDGVNQLNDYLNGTIDFPYKSIPIKSYPIELKDIFYRFANTNITNYNRYTREQLINIDLVINHQRFSSWLSLLQIKIAEVNAIYDSIDITKINAVDVEKLVNAIDACFAKCVLLNDVENPIVNDDFSWFYGLHLYKFHNFFMKSGRVRCEFDGIYTAKRASTNWSKANEILTIYLSSHSMHSEPKRMSLCYFVLGKMIEKKKPIKIMQSTKYYLLAERQMYDHQNDDDFLLIKLEINFRITASIYKYVTQAVDAAKDKNMLERLIRVLKRAKYQIFKNTELSMRTKHVEIIDENANRINVEHENLINEIIKLCTEDFEWYLELCPGYYKAAYYLIKINLNKDYNKCRGLLLQLPRKNNEQEKRLSLFDIHRCRSLFKVKQPMHMPQIHDSTAFAKYMEKCVRILIEYLARKSNWYMQFVLAMQWNKLMSSTTSTKHLKSHQMECLLPMILSNFIRAAINYVQQFNRSTAKTKLFHDFFMTCYEFYQTFETFIKSKHFISYMNLMIGCYRLCADQNSTDNSMGFQESLAFCAKQLNDRTKTDNKTTKKISKTDDNNQLSTITTSATIKNRRKTTFN